MYIHDFFIFASIPLYSMFMVSKQKYIIKNQNRVSKNKIKKLR